MVLRGTKVRRGGNVLCTAVVPQSHVLAGGSVAKHLLEYPDAYRVRALTRDPSSAASQELAKLGAEVVKADLTVPSDVQAALQGCWGIFGVTNFYDSVSWL